MLRGPPPGRGRAAVTEEVGEARAVDRALLLAADRRRRLDPDQLEHRRQHVDRVRELVTDLRRRRPRSAPATARCTDRRRRPRAPRASSAGTACCRPSSSPTGSCCAATGRRARRCARAARVAPPGRGSISRTSLIEPRRTALGAGAVVGHEDDDRVVGVASSPRGARAPGRSASSAWERKPAKHSMKRAATFWSSGVEVVPRRHPRRARRQLGARGHEARSRSGARTSRSRNASHPSSNTPAVALDPLGRRVVRRVARAGGEVEEERLLAVDVAQVAEVLDGVVGEVLGEVVALGERARRLHRVVVAVEGGHELVRLAAVEPVPALEAATERPAAAVGGHVRLVLGREVPLADRVRGVPVRRAGSRTGTRSPAAPSPAVARDSRWRGRRRGPCRSSGGCAR